MTSLEHVLFPKPLRKSRPALFPPISMILVRSTSRHPRKLISAQKSFNQSSWVKDSIATYPSQCSIAPTSFQLGEACLQNMSMRITKLDQKQSKTHRRKTKANYMYTMAPHWAPRSSKEVNVNDLEEKTLLENITRAFLRHKKGHEPPSQQID